jgi:AraC-like DNA-binding protein
MVLLVFFAARILFPLQIIWNFSAFLTLASMYIIGFFGYNQPIIYQQSGKETRTQILQEEKKKYATSSLTKTEMREHAKKLEGLMEHDKLYLKNDLKIGLVAEKLDLPMHHVSQILNEHLGKNFFDFVNEYRVNEVKRRMADSQYDYLTILAIGYDSGFNSKTAFYSAFKRNTGLIPSEYKNTLVHAESTS